ncbi:hypothetical protein TRFO_08001 [Tritrichomonas foetus]|uniref:BEACH domain-containing protein n=1 Tax=Tritrichomonas foetus TaxID=1144522 RepID=A0A1J4JST6_9EUKA|nr:hypothetical protein TRFO_08001 [Tritrichomonas foetus]|eukprot:OHT00333.1 hypothetical protein TRFO_08001 [Tritrichomonas foetus]
MSNDIITDTLVDTIQLLLTESQTADESTRCELILQTDSFFEKVINQISTKSPNYQTFLSTLHLLFACVNSNIRLFLTDTTHTLSLANLLFTLASSQFAADIAQECSMFIISLVFNNTCSDESARLFYPFLQTFFTSPIFQPSFEQSGGLHALWEILVNPQKERFCEIVFTEISQTIHLYFQNNGFDESVGFLSHVVISFKDVPTNNALRTFQFIFDLISNSKYDLLPTFIDEGGFKAFNQYIISHKDPSYLIIYQMFRQICVDFENRYEQNDNNSKNVNHTKIYKINPILNELLNLLLDKNITQEIRIEALKQLHSTLKHFEQSKMPFRSQDLYVLANSINENLEDAVTLLFSICSTLIKDYQFDIAEALPSFIRFFTFTYSMKNDISLLFDTIKHIGSSFLPFSPPFFASLTMKITPEEFYNLSMKYPTLLEILDLYYQDNVLDDHLAELFYQISPKLDDKTLHSAIFEKIINNEGNVNYMINFLQQQTNELQEIVFKQFSEIVCSNQHTRRFIHSINILEKINYETISPLSICDILIGLSGKSFNPDFDRFVLRFLKDKNFLKLPKSSIKKLTFGLYQDDSSTDGHLIFPSLLPYCDNFEIKTPFDMWLCGQYVVEPWLKETGKTIDKFPSIQNIAQRYLLPKHVPLFFDHPKLFSECCNDNFGMIQLFEFAKGLFNTMVSVKITEDTRSVAFWFTICSFPPEKMNIIRFYQFSLGLNRNSLILDDTIICDIVQNRWYHIVLTVNDKLTNCLAYIDNNFTCQSEVQPNDKFAPLNLHINFGESKLNPIQWYIGGSIRVYKSILDPKSIESLFMKGVAFSVKNDSPVETVISNALTFVDLFGNMRPSSKLSENSRPVVSFPFLKHLKQSYKGASCVYGLILKQLREDSTENSIYLLQALCNIQNLKLSGWTMGVFAVRMSSIFLLKPELFDLNILTTILNCFTSDEHDKILWNSILCFILDFGLFNSQHRQFIISKLFEFIAQFSTEKDTSQLISKFIFHVLCIFDENEQNKLDDVEFDTLVSLIHKLNPGSNEIANMILSSLDFHNSLMNPNFQYYTIFDMKPKEQPDQSNNDVSNSKRNSVNIDHYIEFDSKIYKALFDMLLSKLDESFMMYILLFIIPPTDSLTLIKKILSKITNISKNDRELMIYFCLKHSEMKEMWPVFISLITSSVNGEINSETKIENENIPIYLFFLSFLSINTLNNQNDKFWIKLWNQMYSFAMSCTYCITGEETSSKKMIAAITHLLSFGMTSKYKAVFPFCPSITKPEDICEIIIKNGFQYPNDPSTHSLRPNISFKPKFIDDVMNMIFKIIPKKIHLIPPNSNQSISTHRNMYNLDFIKLVIFKNKKGIHVNWHNFIPVPSFSYEDLEKSSIFHDVIGFAVKIGVNLLIQSKSNIDLNNCNTNDIYNPYASFTDPASISTSVMMNAANSNLTNQELDHFNSYIMNIFMNNELITPQHSLTIAKSFIYEILNFCILNKLYNRFLINFVCRRLTVGWFPLDDYVHVTILLLTLTHKCNEQFSRHILEILLFGFDNIPKNQLTSFLNIFITFSSIIFTPSNLNADWFTVLLFEKLHKYRDSNVELITTIIMAFLEKIKQIPEPTATSIKIGDSLVKLAVSTFDLKEINEDLNQQEINSDENENKKEINENNSPLTNDEDIIEKKTIEQLIQFHNTKYSACFRKNIIESLERDTERRDALTAFFYQSVNDILNKFNHYHIYSRSIASIIRHYDIRMLLFELDCFLGQRERVLTTHQFFDIQSSSTKTVSILSDPFSPTKRFENSPMIYELPPFPSPTKNITSVTPKLPDIHVDLSILPESFRSLLSLDYQTYEVLMLHSTKQINLAFCNHFDIDEDLLLSMLFSVMYARSKTEVSFYRNVSLLYGISPLPGVLFVDGKNLYFIEGLRLNETKTGAKFVHSNMNELIYTFYISYIIAGYFGQCSLFHGHPFIQMRRSHLIAAIPHLWLQHEIAIDVNFLLGWSFILIAENTDDYSQLSKSLNETVDSNLSPLPPQTNVPSPINNSRILKHSIKEITKMWSEGTISNNTYLLVLNRLGGRSFADFSQYYIFPWLISDFKTSDFSSIPLDSFRNLSLPMGQIGPVRSPRFQLFFETSGYFYGTHYMHLGVVLFYLIRCDPFSLFSIYFHKGWDHPSRIFSDISEAWLSAALVSQNDVKEVVPQVYMCPEFLVNTSNLPFHYTNEDTSKSTENNEIDVSNVNTAGWSNNVRDFTVINAREMESERVSSQINNWIDLIFGAKSRGEQAIEAKNVFPPLCYAESSKEGNQITSTDEVERNAAVASIINFGQVPRQLFKSIHPQKNKLQQNPHLLSDPSLLIHQKLASKEFRWPVNDIRILPNTILTAPFQSKIIFNKVVTVDSERGALCIDNTTIKKERRLSNVDNPSFPKERRFSNVNVSNVMPETKERRLSSFLLLNKDKKNVTINSPDSPTTTSTTSAATGIISSNSTSRFQITTQNTTSNRSAGSGCNKTSSIVFHSNFESDENLSSLRNENNLTSLFECSVSVDSFVVSPDGSLAALFQKEGSFCVYLLKYEKGEVKTGSLILRFQTLSSVTDAAISTTHFLIVAACGDKIERYDLGLVNELEAINVGFIVRKVIFDDHAALIIACGDDEISIFSVSGEKIITKKIDSAITSIAVANLELHIKDRYFVTGHSNGCVRFWTINFSNNDIICLKNARISENPISCVAISDDSLRVSAAVNDSYEMFCFDFYGSSADNLKKTLACECSTCSKNITDANTKVCYNCHRFFCKDCVPKEEKAPKLRYICAHCQAIRDFMTHDEQ